MMVLPKEFRPEKTVFPVRIKRSGHMAFLLLSTSVQTIPEYKQVFDYATAAVTPDQHLYFGVDWKEKKNCLILLADKPDTLLGHLEEKGLKLECTPLTNHYLLSNELIQDRTIFEIIANRLIGCATDGDKLYVCFDSNAQNFILWVTTKSTEGAMCVMPKGVVVVTATGRKYVMIVDLYRCVGCGACEIACRKEHNLALGLSWTRVKKLGPEKVGDSLAFNPLLMICMHCDDAPCEKVCPTRATVKRSDGTVVVDDKKCIGCRFCMVACPYDARYFSPEKRVVQKCNYCLERLQEGKVPRCVETCHIHARYFGDLEDLNSEVYTLIGSHKTSVLAPEMKTNPSAQYVQEW